LTEDGLVAERIISARISGAIRGGGDEKWASFSSTSLAVGRASQQGNIENNHIAYLTD